MVTEYPHTKKGLRKMPVSVTWPQSDTILMTIEGMWTPEEWLDGYAACTHEVLTRGEPVSLVLNYTNHYNPSGVISNLPRLSVASKRLEESDLLLATIIVGQTGFMRRASEIYITVFKPQNVHFVDTLDEAWTIVGDLQSTEG